MLPFQKVLRVDGGMQAQKEYKIGQTGYLETNVTEKAA